MNYKIFIVTLVFILIGTSVGVFLLFDFPFGHRGEDVEDIHVLSPEEKLQTVVNLRDEGIKEAKARGDYRCCIEPACTMCYMEANMWNNFTPGTCACDDLIARGEEPCPQCKRDLASIHNKENSFCDIDATIATCDSKDN